MRHRRRWLHSCTELPSRQFPQDSLRVNCLFCRVTPLATASLATVPSASRVVHFPNPSPGFPMGTSALHPRIYCFGPFHLDTRTGELTRDGSKSQLHEQPLQLLIALLEQPGELVAREDLVRRLWPDGTFVDFDRGLNKAINKLREVWVTRQRNLASLKLCLEGLSVYRTGQDWGRRQTCTARSGRKTVASRSIECLACDFSSGSRSRPCCCHQCWPRTGSDCELASAGSRDFFTGSNPP